MSSLILEIQRDALNNDVSTLQVLRKLNAAAVKLQLTDVSDWVNAELSGYPDTLYKDLPALRQLHGDPRCQNPYHGWQPLRGRPNGKNDGFDLKLSEFPLRQSVAEVENIIDGNGGGQIYFNFPPAVEANITQAMDFNLPIALIVPVSSLATVLDEIRNKAMQIALELEAKGILGENMSFSSEDKKKASSVTFNVTAENIGSVSSAGDFAEITNENQVFTSANDPQKLSELIGQLKVASEALPNKEKQEILLLTNQLDQDKDDPEKAAGTLQSIKNVCEGAVGNLTAQGILSALGSFL